MHRLTRHIFFRPAAMLATTRRLVLMALAMPAVGTIGCVPDKHLGDAGGAGAGGIAAAGGVAGGGAPLAACGGGTLHGDAGIDEPPVLTAAQGLMLEDFEGEHHDDQDQCQSDSLARKQAAPNRNTLGYCSECFGDCAQNTGGLVETSLVSDPCSAFRSAGHSLRLRFDVSQGYMKCVDPPDGGDSNVRFAGYVQLLTGNDICPSGRGYLNPDSLGLKKLTFWLRPDSGSEDFILEVAFKDLQNRGSALVTGKPSVHTGSYLMAQVWPGGWQKVEIPLEDLRAGGVDFTQLREISFTFTSWRAIVTTGAIVLDEIALER
jgi:hypothetical protein